MQVTAQDTGEVVVLTLTGRLVLEDVEAELRGALDGLIRQGRVKLVLNLQDVTYVDSAGLGFLVSRYVSVHRRGGDMKLVRVQPRVAHVLEIPGCRRSSTRSRWTRTPCGHSSTRPLTAGRFCSSRRRVSSR